MIKREVIQLKSLSSGIEKVKRPETEAAKAAKVDPDEIREEDRYVVRLNVHNPENRTLYAYGTARRIQYDNATHRLKLTLHDHYLDDDSVVAKHLKRPRIVPLEAKSDTEIKLPLPIVVNRLRSATERAGGPLSERLNIAEATDVDIEVAHQDTPFYYNPKISMAKQLKQWGSAVAKGKFKVRPPRDNGDPPKGDPPKGDPPKGDTPSYAQSDKRPKTKTGPAAKKKTAPPKKKGGPPPKKGAK